LEAEQTLTSNPARPRNLMLQRMPADRYAAIEKALVQVDLPAGLRLSEPNQIVRYAYFPVSGLISVDALTKKGESVEVGVIGREGFAGLPALLGDQQMEHSVIMQGAGTGLRIRTNILREEFLRGGPFADLVHQFIYLQLVQSSQSALCNRLHPVDARMARWMLTASDRLESTTLNLTQEFLAQMLGSRRSTVTVAAGELQRHGMIDYARGRIKILDRAGLEQVACECYQIVRSAYDRVLGSF
jgi:CRP-like cAMP-binding protein